MSPASARNAGSRHRAAPLHRHLLRDTIILITLAVPLAGFLVSCSDDPAQPVQSPAAFEWPVATPASQEFNGVVLDTLTARLARGQFGRISSLLIVREGYLVYEQYFRDMARDQLHDAYSVTKSVSSALIGIAIDKGMIPGLDEKLVDYFEDYADVPAVENDVHPRENITLEHMLGMQAGFEWDEFSVPYGTPQNPVTGLLDANDMYRYTLDRPVVHEPGTRFAYNTGISTLLAGVLQQASGKNAREFAIEHLFGPLDITYFGWRRGGNYVYLLGSGLEMLPRDMAKFGYLYANDGVWQGRRLLSTEWIDRSWRSLNQLPDGRGYGLHWWLLPVENNGGTLLLPYALGWGEQHIFVAREYRLVIVSTAEKYRGGDGGIFEVLGLIGQALEATTPAARLQVTAP